MLLVLVHVRCDSHYDRASRIPAQQQPLCFLSVPGDLKRGFYMSKLIRMTRCLTLLICAVWCGAAWAQNPAHPDAKPHIDENPYLSYREPWRWDVRTQLFLNSANIVADDPRTPRRSVNERVYTVRWEPKQIEVVYPIVREGSFYWSPNRTIDASIRLDDVLVCSVPSGAPYDSRLWPDAPYVEKQPELIQKFVPGSYAEYAIWQSGDIAGSYRTLHYQMTSHIVSADTVFNDDQARTLAWPESWSVEATAYLSPIVDTVGEPVAEEGEQKIQQLLEFWTGEGVNPTDAPQLDVVKFLTGKVIEYYTVRGQATEYARRSTGGGRPSLVVSANTWGGFIVDSADKIAENPTGSRHGLAVLLTSVLRAAGVPARTVICINELETDPLIDTVSLVEFAMYDPERDQTFWVPIDVDRVRISGGRSSQFKRKWLYFGTHDELSHMIPISYYFHPPARYRAYDLPLLYGIRGTSDESRLPDYMIQSLLVDPMVTPASTRDNVRQEQD